MIRVMTMEDYDSLFQLWNTIEGLGIRKIDDSREGIERFLKRNPTTSVVAEEDGKIVGGILCGHDGRRGCFYHVCVAEDYRHKGIGTQMALKAVEALREEKINKVSLIAFRRNFGGNAFWKKMKWEERTELNYYDYSLDENNVTIFVEG
ncbi:GNAT family N-acetyltransferase [Anaerosacchariphilus polymeriproducens]|uniref:GNAT family N-acetyltransferase n=1 Tax=Anaerosacchariphilus polymeriproducens TaxID=1812858 RepID=A0A371AWS2_9FIRM|nr:GNAT family N-acetyltransferase [Anaerosacchariphilus polymeriproducens]RDU23991.1 GNAT family N-acetyltransferase [Anaerosacchariphilus polymeriproducens]